MHRKKNITLVVASGGALLFVTLAAWSVKADDECCEEVGQAHECWLEDAEDDGATCIADGDCPSGNCNETEGLCICNPSSADDSQCNDGVCTGTGTSGLCGPSWCNGYKICSCWGGCIPANSGVMPSLVCEADELLCCDGDYPIQPVSADAPAGSGFCSSDPSCGEGCTEDDDCDDDNPCTTDDCIFGGCVNTNLDGTLAEITASSGVAVAAEVAAYCDFPTDLSEDCAEPMCTMGACDILVITPAPGECTDNLDPPTSGDADPACWHGECDAAGACVLTDDTGAECPTANLCTLGVCLSDYSCDEYPLTDTTTPSFYDIPACCNGDFDRDNDHDGLDFPESYEVAAQCQIGYCNINNHDGIIMIDGVDCDGGTDDDDCNFFTCDDGTCTEYYEDLGSDCPNDQLEDDDVCGYWACNGAGGCVETPTLASANVVCEYDTVHNDMCAVSECDGAGNCVPNMTLGQVCVPWGGEADCTDYTCQDPPAIAGDMLYCLPSATYAADPAIEDCSPGGDLNTIGTTEVSVSGDSTCAIDDYEAYGSSVSPRFADCEGMLAGTKNADVVYHFDYTVDDDIASSATPQLDHIAARLLPDEAGWDPYLYSRTGCDGTTAGTQITCNSNCAVDEYSGLYSGCATGPGARVTVGPSPLRDRPDDSDTADYIATANDWYGSFVVDTWNYSKDDPGGLFVLDAIKEPHTNDSCLNTADYIAAPMIERFGDWKRRWQGNVSGYSDFFDRYAFFNSGPDCASTSNNRAGFFRVDLPTGYDDMADVSGGDETDAYWYHNYKVSLNNTDMVLAYWGRGTPNTVSGCTSALGANEHTCVADTPYSTSPREKVILNSGSDQTGWLSVSNEAAGSTNNYELSAIRAPRKSMPLVKLFAGNGSVTSGGCCTSSTVTPGYVSNTFNMAGARLDFSPTNHLNQGYFVVATKPSSGLTSGWLVEPVAAGSADWSCSGLACRTPSGIGPLTMGFAMPMAGDFYDAYCIDMTGRVDLRKSTDGSGTCSNANYMPNSELFAQKYGSGGNAPSLAVLWGNNIPCWDGAGVNWTSGGCISCFGGLVTKCVKIWNEGACNGGRNGTIVSFRTIFENQPARVIAWQGFERYMEPTAASSSPASADAALNFEVIIRADGRITYFYKTGSTNWTNILDMGFWAVGISGGRAIGCGSATCAVGGASGVLAGSDLEIACDDTPYSINISVSIPFLGTCSASKSVYTPHNFCQTVVWDYFDGASTGIIEGDWQGVP